LTNKIFYIGKGTGKRAYTGARNTKWTLFVKFLEEQGLTYETKILHVCDTEEEAFKLEKDAIKDAMFEGLILLNNQTPHCNVDSVTEIQLGVSEFDGLIISDYVKRKRKLLKLTQLEMSKKAGVGLRFVREMEQGKTTLRMDKVNQVLALFGARLVPYQIKR